MPKILITGGLGFIGSHCIEKWKENDWDICVIDNLSTNAIPTDHNLTKNVEIIVDDILNVKWENLSKFDFILHLALSRS